MSIDYKTLRLDGVYQQDPEGNLMLRIKVPAGVLSSTQAEAVCDIAERFARGRLHLTVRCSIELHWLRYEDLPEALRSLAAVGLTSRGACGGAVRGISCSTSFSPGFEVVQMTARRLQRHFAGNPHFEGLPKKFKIGMESGYDGARHLIQDIGLVFLGEQQGRALFDVWAAGGLGREPQESFLLANRVAEKRLIPMIEAVVRIYKEHTPPGRRLKHLLREIGEERFRELLRRELAVAPAPESTYPLDAPLTAPLGEAAPIEAAVFAGEIEAGAFRGLAQTARRHSGGFLVLTSDQNVAFFPPGRSERDRIASELSAAGFDGDTPRQQVSFRVCPGSHECRMGLSPTREVAAELIEAMTRAGRKLGWAISGCPNSCSQPQLADAGIVTSKAVKGEDVGRTPRFDLYRRRGEGLGEKIANELTLEELLHAAEQMA